jgi:hypothetical protein
VVAPAPAPAAPAPEPEKKKTGTTIGKALGKFFGRGKAEDTIGADTKGKGKAPDAPVAAATAAAPAPAPATTFLIDPTQSDKGYSSAARGAAGSKSRKTGQTLTEGKGTAGRSAAQQLRPKMSEAKLNGVLSLQRYLLAHDLASLFPAFEAHEITLNQVMTMNEENLKELKIPINGRKKLLALIDERNFLNKDLSEFQQPRSPRGGKANLTDTERPASPRGSGGRTFQAQLEVEVQVLEKRKEEWRQRYLAQEARNKELEAWMQAHFEKFRHFIATSEAEYLALLTRLGQPPQQQAAQAASALATSVAATPAAAVTVAAPAPAATTGLTVTIAATPLTNPGPEVGRTDSGRLLIGSGARRSMRASMRSKGPAPKAPTSPTRAERVRARCLFDYRADNQKELSFKTGDIITILNQDSSGWWLAHHEGRSGFVPKNYLELIVAAAQPGAIVAGTAPPATVATANGSGAP